MHHRMHVPTHPMQCAAIDPLAFENDGKYAAYGDWYQEGKDVQT